MAQALFTKVLLNRMSANSFGHILKIHSFGESHGQAMGVVIDGLPAGIQVDHLLLLNNLKKRRPGQSEYVSPRNEPDQPQIVSGVFEDKTLGTPICVLIENVNQKSADYKNLKDRIGHADDVWREKFQHVDPRGGGRASARETVSRVIAGSFAQMFLNSLQDSKQTHVVSYVTQIGSHKMDKSKLYEAPELSHLVADSPIRTPDKNFENKTTDLLLQAKNNNESYGGWIETKVFHPPELIGEPVFYKLKSELAKAVTSIGACVGFYLGSSLEPLSMKGSEFHAAMDSDHYAGIRGGISTGETITFNAAFKPTSSIKDVAKNGRHDPCILPRATAVVEAMTYLVLADLVLWKRSMTFDNSTRL